MSLPNVAKIRFSLVFALLVFTAPIAIADKQRIPAASNVLGQWCELTSSSKGLCVGRVYFKNNKALISGKWYEFKSIRVERAFFSGRIKEIKAYTHGGLILEIRLNSEDDGIIFFSFCLESYDRAQCGMTSILSRESISDFQRGYLVGKYRHLLNF